jgi:putative Mg2+ transporter-C (MgtC) family protein
MLPELGGFGGDLERILFAIALGACIGWEREWRRKPAGLRTHVLVTLGAAGFVISALRLAEGSGGEGELQVDVAKVIEGVAGGIGFLGAGTIIQGRGNVEGLTTAATIWLAGAVGVACAIDRYALATTLTAVALFVLIALGALTRHVHDEKESPQNSKEGT